MGGFLVHPRGGGAGGSAGRLPLPVSAPPAHATVYQTTRPRTAHSSELRPSYCPLLPPMTFWVQSRAWILSCTQRASHRGAAYHVLLRARRGGHDLLVSLYAAGCAHWRRRLGASVLQPPEPTLRGYHVLRLTIRGNADAPDRWEDFYRTRRATQCESEPRHGVWVLSPIYKLSVWRPLSAKS